MRGMGREMKRMERMKLCSTFKTSKTLNLRLIYGEKLFRNALQAILEPGINFGFLEQYG